MNQYKYITFFLMLLMLLFSSCDSGNDDVKTNTDIVGTWEITSRYIISDDKDTEKRINNLFVLFGQSYQISQVFREVEKGTGVTSTYIINRETQEQQHKREGSYTIKSNSFYMNEGYALDGTCAITSTSMEMRFPVTKYQLDPLVREIGGDVYLTPDDIEATLVILME